jgi:RNA polymerase sigma factor (sigma-70 family)
MKRDRASQTLEDLPARLRSTEPAAFEEFAEYFGPRFRGLFLGKGLPPDEAEDLAATCVTDIQLKVDRYRQLPRGSFKAWVFVLARHALADWYRAKQRTPTRRPPSEVALNVDVEVVLADATAILAVQEAIATLPRALREVVTLRDLGPQMTYQQIGERLSIKEGTARVRHLRALRQLRVQLESDHHAEPRQEPTSGTRTESQL